MKSSKVYDKIVETFGEELDDIKTAVLIYEVEKFRRDTLDKLSTAQEVIEYVCENNDVSIASLTGNLRHKKLVEARQLIWWLLQNKVVENNLTCVALGRMFNRDHATVLHGVRKINDIVSVDAMFRDALMMAVNHFGKKTTWNPHTKDIKITQAFAAI
tara:strand:+ start:3059 stop:3532 length:474 start_codon:yes stop_codon:yes gene_type:complete